MITYTNKELTAQVQDLKQQLAKALAAVAKYRGDINEELGCTFTEFNKDKIYQAYPRKVGKAAAIKAITKALTKIDYNGLLNKVQAYANATAWQENRSLIPHPATWFNQERWLDDPKEWEQPTQGRQGPDPTKSILG